MAQQTANNMKLYTEEQVIEMLELTNLNVQFHLDTMTPIELPNDEEIEKVYNTRLLYTNDNSANFRLGAKWMRDKILNK